MHLQLLSIAYRYFGLKLDKSFLEITEKSRDIRDVSESLLFHSSLENAEKRDVLLGLQKCHEVLDEIVSLNAKVLYPGHVDYPVEFYALSEPPVFLSVLGSYVWKASVLISIVGAREPTYDALVWMEKELSQVLERNQYINFVSGAARGIDQEAHRISIVNDRPTLALLPSGLKKIYPSDFDMMAQMIVESGGCLMSEYFPKDEVKKRFFHQRNRLIANLGQIVLVVQARQRSGSLLTARLALEMGKTIGAVPWDVLEPRAFGTNQLLFDGAQIIRQADDLLQLLSKEVATCIPTPRCESNPRPV